LIDSAGDCAAMMEVIDKTGSFFLTKAKIDAPLFAAIARQTEWTTTGTDADGKPTRQVAELKFVRDSWAKAGKEWRVIAVRSTEREGGKPLWLWPELEMTVQVFLSNDFGSDPDELARQYDGRAGVEPKIAELKSHWGIGKVSSHSFNANQALLLLKVLTHNLLRRYAAQCVVPKDWRTPWLRRGLIQVAARLSRGPGRTWVVRLGPQPMVVKREGALRQRRTRHGGQGVRVRRGRGNFNQLDGRLHEDRTVPLPSMIAPGARNSRLGCDPWLRRNPAKRRPTLRSSSAQRITVTTGRPWGQ
jgi:hypothetical protein